MDSEFKSLGLDAQMGPQMRLLRDQVLVSVWQDTEWACVVRGWRGGGGVKIKKI